ncbi:acyclic terpene utilization AtuA family protein [Kordiimonas sp. SCSIO 12610]|uniref:acyclic terpene utilization AtuA family protein n=1 Tax=Kordiimonas sp. SCSIO 12610 TaxID=2829597 RepID=UPI00210BF339|nr:acyclic terpene utilization AtuA family protein [Kordiimonas sp. SCSIO 12610]UTW54768.1 DUF1446 domain-containing protein [Kordiimonas sp. SCSIO 12610]
MADKPIKIGGACGYWGESAVSTPQLLQVVGLDYIVYDYLAEITMSIMARARASDPEKGYATDFISAVLKPNLKAIADKGVKILSNAGGVNPEACGKIVRSLVQSRGLDLKVAVITGDDLMPQLTKITEQAPTEMFTGGSFPSPDKVASMNAYLGAAPVVAALAGGADIVITGRCADSALTLAACQHEFGWQDTDYDLLAVGSLAGHLLECGPQATGGNFTDWHLVADTIHNIGYPIAEISADGSMIISKPENTGGLVSVGTVSEQLVYEIEDPQNYMLPDVICDLSDVKILEIAQNRAAVSGAKGKPPTGKYKVSTTYMDGYKCGALMTFVGYEAAKKAETLSNAIFKRAEAILRASNAGEYTEKSTELIGNDSQFGGADTGSREVTLKIAAKHPRAEAIGLLLKEMAGIGLATPAGLTAFNASRPKPMPVVRLFSFLIDADQLDIQCEFDNSKIDLPHMSPPLATTDTVRPNPPKKLSFNGNDEVPLIDLAWARSGDKGDRANVGIIARRPEYLPYIWHSLTEESVKKHFAHFNPSSVERFLMPGMNAINFILHDVLGGGGVASLRADPQGKAYGQILLHYMIKVPEDIMGMINEEKATS